jgi:hypothetical protein
MAGGDTEAVASGDNVSGFTISQMNNMATVELQTLLAKPPVKTAL